MAVPRVVSNQSIQVGPEVTSGTPVACTKILDAWMWTFGLKATTKQFTGQGHQYPSASAMLWEESSAKASGPGDFAQMVYIFSTLWGSGAPALHSPSTTAYDWIWTPLIIGSYANVAKTLTAQIGDPTTGDAEQYGYLAATGFGYDINRKQEMTISADFIAQTFTDGITMTSSPTTVAQNPMVGAQFNYYLDSTSGGIGGTQLLDVLKISYKASDYYEGYYPINRANASFTSLKDKAKKHELTLTLQANAVGVGFKSTYLDTGALCYVRVAAVGPTIDAGHSITAMFTHDMACVFSNMAEFSDEEGVYAVQYTLTVVQDAAWNSGQAQKMTLTNLVSAL